MTGGPAAGRPYRASPHRKVSLLLVATMVLTLVPAAPAGAAGRWTREACGLPTQWLRRIVAGYHPGRSGEVAMVPKLWNYFDNHSHAGPWPYLQEIPMFLYGPGHVTPSGRIDRPVKMEDLAPTLAEHLQYPFEAKDGRSMGAVEPAATRPRAIVIVVWDGGGRNVLRKHSSAWPNMRGLIPEGAWFNKATVGSSPSTTPAIHTTLGSGAVPKTHGIVDLEFRVGRKLRSIRDSVSYFRTPSLADLYDRDNGNEPVMAMVGNGLTIGMVGRGSALPGGDRDLLLAHGKKASWSLPRSARGHFDLPAWVPQVPKPAPGPNLDESPRYTRYVGRVVEELIKREAVGQDQVPDLVFVNFKQIDKVGHHWSMNSPKMAKVVRAADAATARLIEVLEAQVGPGEWILGVTADHGSTPDARASGGFSISRRELQSDLEARFDRDGDGRSVVNDVASTQIYLNLRELRQNGFGTRAVARFLLGYSQRQNGGRGTKRVFQSAFPTSVLRRTLPCLSP